jgi:hypothetical protein
MDTDQHGLTLAFTSYPGSFAESLFEKSTKAPREGTRPTGNGQNFNPLQARSPDRAIFQTRSELIKERLFPAGRPDSIDGDEY